MNYITVALHQKRNLINMKRNKINSRFYATIEVVLDYLDKLGIPYKDDRSKNRINIIYARVSSNEQKQKGDLDRQVGYISSKCNKSNPFEIITDVGSGLNTNRKGLNKLIKYVIEDKVDTVSNGDTNVVFIRKKENKNEPFYTVEIQSGRITQIHGLQNCNPTSEVLAFVVHWAHEKKLKLGDYQQLRA